VTLVYLDPAGTGDSDPLPDGDYSMSRYARFAAAVLDDLDASTGYFLGHSHGGFAGLQLGIDHPERLSGLILYDTAPVYGPELMETATKEMERAGTLSLRVTRDPNRLPVSWDVRDRLGTINVPARLRIRDPRRNAGRAAAWRSQTEQGTEGAMKFAPPSRPHCGTASTKAGL
jgi:proline iminopeptidase